MESINLVHLHKMIEEKYISVQKHPTEELYIYNYTQNAQFDRMWNNETLQCRGLIMDENATIVARPFPKFFNLDEAINQGEQLPVEDFEVTEKMDGSLGILYWIGDTPFLATRGSFTSDQAVKGTLILQKYGSYFAELNREYTYLFEILYPENRIVVDYGGREDIVLLAVIDTQTGEDISLYEACSGFPFNAPLKGITDYSTLKERQEDNKEGFVIRFAGGKRYKVKFDEYVRLHRLVTGVNARSIWDLLRNKQPFEELLERVPDEFYQWVKNTKEELELAYTAEEQDALRVLDMVKELPTRKEQALAILKNDKEISGVVFAMLNGKPYEEVIWKRLRPSAQKPWKEDVDA